MGAESSVAQKRKEVAKQVVCTLVEHKKNEAIENDHLEQECIAKEQAEQEQRESQKGDKSPSLEREEEELSGQGGEGDEGQRTPFILKRRGKEK